MNRKRKSVDVLAQLGEPLPLPYRPTSQSVKTEIEDEGNNSEIISDTFRPRQVLLRHSRDREFETSRPRLPVWQNRQVSSVEMHIEETTLESIESKIASLRTEIDSGNDLAAEKETLELINKQLDRIIEQRHENTLMQELKKLQHSSDVNVEKKCWTGKSWTAGSTLLLAVALVVLLGAVSFIANSYSYEYCYYFC